MTVTAVHPYINALLEGSSNVPRSPATWINARRGAALERANALTVPTTRDEDWRFTDITPLTKIHFRPVPHSDHAVQVDITRFVLPESVARLVFIDGIFVADLSECPSLPQGMRVERLAGPGIDGPSTEKHLTRHASFEENVFAALNTAYLHDGALVTVRAGAACTKPVHLLYLTTRKEVAVYPRCLVVAGEASECTLVEDYVSVHDGTYMNNAVAEIAVGTNARVRHVKLQRESPTAFHISNCAVALDKDARYESNTVTLGARISRNNLNVTQSGEGAEVILDGLTLISGRQLADTHTLMDHARPHGRCVQLHKTIVGGAAHAVFNGKVVVRPGAQLTDSSQQSRNLLLSGKAHVDTKPQLEIYADDVKCAHGATVGQLDPEQLFYLKSRGLPEGRARSLLTYAFGAEIIDRIPVPSLVDQLERTVLEQTAGQDRAKRI